MALVIIPFSVNLICRRYCTQSDEREIRMETRRGRCGGH